MDLNRAADLVAAARTAAGRVEDDAAEATRLMTRAGVDNCAPAALIACAAGVADIATQADSLAHQLASADSAFSVMIEVGGEQVRISVVIPPDIDAEGLFALLGQLGHGTGALPADPQGVRAVFEALPPVLARRLALEAPAVVGGLDGVPAPLRDRANRVLIDRDLDVLGAELPATLAQLQDVIRHNGDLLRDDDLVARLTAMDPAAMSIADVRDLVDLVDQVPIIFWPGDRDPHGRVVDFIDTEAVMRDRVRIDRLESLRDDRSLSVLVYDGTENGRIALGLGDLETADTVSTIIPGTSTTLNSLHANSDYRTWLDNLHGSTGDDTATVLWLDYDAPQSVVPEAAQARFADDAALRFPDFTAGLGTANDAEQVVFGHSYGGVVLATAGPDLADVDTAVLLGAPGMRVFGLTDPPFPDDTRVVAATYPDDPILYATIIPRWGIDPIQHRGVDVVDLFDVDLGDRSAVERHMAYLSHRESLNIFAAIVRGEQVELRHNGSSGP